MYTYTLFQYIQLHSITCSAKPRSIQIAGNLVAPSVDRLDLLVLKTPPPFSSCLRPAFGLKRPKIEPISRLSAPYRLLAP